MIRKIIIFLFLLINALIYKVHAQEVHNSQYYAMPLYLNPANTGDSNFDFRSGLSVRNQWSTASVPFSAQYLYGDVKIPTKLIQRAWFGLGISLLNDIAGDGINSRYGALSLGFHKLISRGDDLLLSGGITTQIINKSVDYNNINFAQEWVDSKFEKGVVGDLTGSSSMFYIDLSIGTKLTYFFNGNKYSIGVSASHINQPSESFYRLTNNLATKYSLYLESEFWIAERQLKFEPSLVLDMQEGETYLLGGFNILKPFNIRRSKCLILGLWYRSVVEVIPVVGLEFNKFKFIASYDVPLHDMTYRKRGGFEISVTYKTGYKNPIEQIRKYRFLKKQDIKRGAIPCPQFTN